MGLVLAHHVEHIRRLGIRAGADVDLNGLTLLQLGTGGGVRADDGACRDLIAGFIAEQGLEALAGQSGFHFLLPEAHIVVHDLFRRLGTHADGDPDIGALLHLGAALRLLAHNDTLAILAVILLGPQLQMEIGKLLIHVHAVSLSQKVGHLDVFQFLIQQHAVKQGHQEHRNGKDGNGTAHHNGHRSHPAALLLFPLPLLHGTAVLGPAGSLSGLPVAGGVHGSGGALSLLSGSRSPCIGTDPAAIGGCTHRGLAGFGLHHLFGSGSGLDRGAHRGNPLGGIVYNRVIVKHNGRILAEFLHVLQHFRGRNIAVLNFQGHTLHNDLLQAPGNVGVQGGGHGCAAVDVLNGHRHRGFSVIGRAAGHHFVHDNAQRIDIAAVVRMTALGLLRGNVMYTAQSLLGQGVALAHNPGNAEVHDLHAAVFQHHHIVRLDVPVDDAPAVGVFQSLGDLHGKVEGFLPVENPLLFHVLLQGNAVNQFHDNVVCLIGTGNVIDLHNVGMAQHGHGLALGVEAAAEFLIPGKLVF